MTENKKCYWVVIRFIDGKWTDHKVCPDTQEGIEEAFDILSDLRLDDRDNKNLYHVIERVVIESGTYSPLE